MDNQSVTITMPASLAKLHWLAMLNIARSKTATYAARERAKHCAKVYQAVVNGARSATIPAADGDETAAEWTSQVSVPPANDLCYYRVDYAKDGRPVDNADSRYEAPSAWALLEVAKGSNMPLPPGVAQWLYHARVGEQAKFYDRPTGLTCLFKVLEGKNK